jgi:hypothetical protein
MFVLLSIVVMKRRIVILPVVWYGCETWSLIPNRILVTGFSEIWCE